MISQFFRRQTLFFLPLLWGFLSLGCDEGEKSPKEVFHEHEILGLKLALSTADGGFHTGFNQVLVTLEGDAELPPIKSLTWDIQMHMNMGDGKMDEGGHDAHMAHGDMDEDAHGGHGMPPEDAHETEEGNDAHEGHNEHEGHEPEGSDASEEEAHDTDEGHGAHAEHEGHDGNGMVHGTPQSALIPGEGQGAYLGEVVFLMASEGESRWFIELFLSLENGESDSLVIEVEVKDKANMKEVKLEGDSISSWVSLDFFESPKVGQNPYILTVHRLDEGEFSPVNNLQIEAHPDMPSMGHGAPNSVHPAFTENGQYRGSANFTMPGHWVLDFAFEGGKSLAFDVHL